MIIEKYRLFSKIKVSYNFINWERWEKYLMHLSFNMWQNLGWEKLRILLRLTQVISDRPEAGPLSAELLVQYMLLLEKNVCNDHKQQFTGKIKWGHQESSGVHFFNCTPLSGPQTYYKTSLFQQILLILKCWNWMLNTPYVA